MESPINTSNQHQFLTNLKPKVWEYVNRQLVKKAMEELAHELLLYPKLQFQKNTISQYLLIADNGTSRYEFHAKRYALDHWEVIPDSIVKYENGIATTTLDAVHFIWEFNERLQIPDSLLSTYIEEITSTLYSAAYKYTHESFTSQELISKDFQTIEHAMTEGHPCFIANNGRIGFDASEYLLYAPETHQTFELIWLAGHKRNTTFTAIQGFEYTSLMQKELGAKMLVTFNTKLQKMGLNMEEYLFIPVHPWQWNHKIQQLFAADIIQRDLVVLGTGPDAYSAQQSIRTLYNQTNPKKCYTKTALSILNMGFVRGLSAYYMKSTPAITIWITELLGKDSYLQKTGFTMLQEAATIGYENARYSILGEATIHNKLLAALWRESPHSKIKKNQQLMTMASLLHVDYSGGAFVAEVIRASGLDTADWITRYLQGYLSPLLHCFYQYEVLFMPHGENVIMVLENHIPVKILMKDITEEVIVFDKSIVLPEKVQRLYTETSDTMKILAIFTDVFDCFFRFMAPILETNLAFAESEFWKLVAACIYEYQDMHPQLRAKFDRYDLFVPEFDRCCLNRLQLKNTKQMLDLAAPIDSLQLVGKLENPIAPYRRELLTVHGQEISLKN